ncbi:hypothetical protein TNCT_245841 [Trichonephila clavata]|uniref:Uncharacterized protein n=1 Tax=Trichonephila clavata TaxID=2740835 RepID=A0A8X6L337_TRICU|nr:hypothetical protein TNCT_245841 [Trichonephila clavata]
MGSVCREVVRHKVGRPQSFLTITQVDEILWRVEETLKVSPRELARELNSSKNTVHMLLWTQELYPFRYKTRRLSETYGLLRMNVTET